mmetsp:Transcript_48675/g.141952  ORF Transcript_48675/g.141952 Transcript_48675/m.141952 type:complete len:264 (+) Transcript_48675:533-1324(+)
MSLELQPVDCLQQLGLLVQQLALCGPPGRLVEAGLRDAVRLVQPPSLELAVQNPEILQGLRVHPPFDLALVPEVRLQLPALGLLRVQLHLVGSLPVQLPGSPPGDHAPGVALDDHALFEHERRLVRTAEVRPSRRQLHVGRGVDVEAVLGHLGAVVPLALRGPRPVLVGLRLPVEPDLVDFRFRRRCGLRQRMMVHSPMLLVPEAAQVRLLRDRALHVHRDDPFLPLGVGDTELQGVRHRIVLGWLLLIVVYPELDAAAVTRF